jgi:2'-5' RNA ligase
MPESLRTFIAIEIPLPPSLQKLLEELRDMGPALKLVDTESTHITLKFLGDTPIESVPEICKTLDVVAGEAEAFALELVGTGAFPHWGRPQVVWIGVSPKAPLEKLAARLESELEPMGFPKENRAYNPHLTLARIKTKPPKELKPLADGHGTTSFGRQTIDRVILYQSVLQKSGPVYTPLATVPLGADRSA